MANVHHIITLGIGTPADIPHFLNVGLSIGAAGPSLVADTRVLCASDDMLVTPTSDAFVIVVPKDDGVPTP